MLNRLEYFHKKSAEETVVSFEVDLITLKIIQETCLNPVIFQISFLMWYTITLGACHKMCFYVVKLFINVACRLP